MSAIDWVKRDGLGVVTLLTLGLLAACSRSSAPTATSATGSSNGCTAPTSATYQSLYSGPGQRPGPDLLYAGIPDAPQLQNTGVWQAPPILVSGASSYRDCEFVYQDFLYDDHGAKQILDPTDPLILAYTAIENGNVGAATAASIFAVPNGTYTYPTSASYAGNAADLVEFRVKPLSNATAFRVTLNTLIDPTLVGFTIALGSAAGSSVAWPHGANVSSPAALFLTVHGSTAELLNANGSAASGDAPTVSVDMTRRQFTVMLPHSAWNPSGQTERIAMGVGLWNTSSNQYLLPSAIASSSAPGGAGLATAPAAFFNLAFRSNTQEPMPDIAGLLNAGTAVVLNPSWWRDAAQGAALASGDISSFFADIDFKKLASGVNDDMPDQPGGVPQSGPMDRIHISHFETAQGEDFSKMCSSSAGCVGEYLGRLQPYAIYIPPSPPPPGGWGLTLLLHSLSANYNQFLNSSNQSEFAKRGLGSIVITAEARGADGWYYEYAGADVFEMWADVAARFPLNPADTAIAGYSMGGYATYKFATQFPDLFGKAQPTVGPPGLGVWVPPVPPTPGGTQSNTNTMLASLRNIPFLIWDGTEDELVPVLGAQTQADTFGSLGLQYEFDLFLTSDHLALAANDAYQPAADFLGLININYNPPHVTYVYNPTMDFANVNTAAGHAYWVSGITLRDSSGANPLGQVDVRSEGFGLGDPTPSGVTIGAGVLQGGAIAPFAYVSNVQTLSTAPVTPVADTLDITATNISSIIIDPSRAKVDCNAKLNITSDGPIKVTLLGC